MKKIIFLLLVFVILVNVQAQEVWTCGLTKSQETGIVKYAMVYGEDKSKLVVDNFVGTYYRNIYITGVEYFLGDNARLYIVFDDSNKVYDIPTRSGYKLDFWEFNVESKEFDFFLDKLKKCNFVSIRIKSSLVDSEYRFSLKKSRFCINYIFK